MAQHQVIVTHGLKQRTPQGWLKKGKGIGASTEGQTAYASIANQIQKVADDTATLDKAEAAAQNRGRAEIKARNVALSDLKKSIRAFLGALQVLCDAAPDAAHAAQLAVGAGVAIKGTTVRAKDGFSGKAIGNGAVHLYARIPGKKRARIFWEWQMSTDGKTWTTVAITNDADFLVENLTVATMPEFRCRYTLKNAPSAWSQTIVVHVL